MKENRIVSFDGLRGIAVLSVVLFHCFYMLTSNDFRQHNVISIISKYGWLGVDLFFIISGFVISFTLYKYSSVKEFFIARFARLYPAYWASVIFAAILSECINGNINLSQYVINLLMFQQLLHFPSVSGVYWTLSFELTFYALMAIVFYLGLFMRHKIFIFWVVVTLAWQIINYLGLDHSHSIISKLGYLFVLQYSPLFMFGIYLHKVFLNGLNKLNLLMLLFLSIMFIALFPESAAQGYNVDMCRFFMAIIFLLCFYATCFPKDKYLSSKFLVFFGKISYSWYLIHLMFSEFIFNISAIPHIINPAYTSFVLSMFVAILFNKYIENPSHNLVMMVSGMRKNRYENIQLKAV